MSEHHLRGVRAAVALAQSAEAMLDWGAMPTDGPTHDLEKADFLELVAERFRQRVTELRLVDPERS